MEGSVNLYMLIGGTNFGFTAGANYDEPTNLYTPDTTSYDYGSPISECGDITEKYIMFRECFSKYVSVPEAELPKPSLKMNYGKIKCEKSVELFCSLDNKSTSIF